MGTDIGFLTAHKLPVADDYFYSKQFPTKSDKIDNITIVTIDNETMYKNGRLQYKRSMFAKVFAKILEGGPKAIGVDIFFDGIRDIKDDLCFINMLNDANGNIVLGIYKNEPENFLLNIDNITSEGYFNGNKMIALGNVQGIVDNSTYGGITKLLLTPHFDNDLTIYYPLPIVVLSKYFNAIYKSYPFEDDDDIASIGNVSIPTFTENCHKRYMYINYVGGLEVFNPVPFEKVPDMNPAVFKDKIVLIGVTADSMEDSHRTPLSRNTPGVVVHANIIHTIINKRFISPLRQKYQSLGVFFVAIVVFIPFYYTRMKISIPATLLTLVIVKLTIDLLFTRYGVYVQFFPFIVSTVFAGMCAMIFRKDSRI
ncbi:CHASE2 domain-containing protein [Candidatus Magnetominusculus xianensis]|nr:CHASE2 domain-containing protein [Candidatus Magnetominusculus xianensis]MBF0403879.1 CHASE2 domain-containing protein [Nitrospirota bacterium]